MREQFDSSNFQVSSCSVLKFDEFFQIPFKPGKSYEFFFFFLIWSLPEISKQALKITRTLPDSSSVISTSRIASTYPLQSFCFELHAHGVHLLHCNLAGVGQKLTGYWSHPASLCSSRRPAAELLLGQGGRVKEARVEICKYFKSKQSLTSCACLINYCPKPEGLG